VLVDKQVAKFCNGMNGHGLHISLFFIGIFLPKSDLTKTLKFENEFFLEDFNHQK
jgi:hypothetical protein